MTEDNLTRAEAAQRATTIAGVTYDIHLDLTSATGDAGTFLSQTTARFMAPLVGLSSFIDLDAESVREFTLNGRSFDPAVFDAGRSRVPLRTLLANNELRVVADCRYQHTGVGLHRFVDPADGNTYLHTQFEPYDAHRVFACFDQPDIKATFTLTVEAPEGWTVVSNSVAECEGCTWRFSPTPVLSTYLVAVIAGPYREVRSSHRARDGEVDLGIFCRESLAPHLDAPELFALTGQGLDFFEAEFALPYPFEKYDQLFVPEFNYGAMENPGAVTFNEQMIFRARQTDAAYENRANTLLHEMAHMWFGDLVTMRWWDDLWLNESFATYMASAALVRGTRFTDAWVRFASGTKAHARAQDQLPSTHPISADIVDTDAVRLHFDGITYSKGASVLRQLVAWVGEEAFTQGVRRYFERHQWSNATLADFLGPLEETSGRDLTPWSAEWLETAGVNTLRIESDQADGRYTAVAVRQEGQPGHDTLRSHRLALGLYDLDPKGHLARRGGVELDVGGPLTAVPELAGEAVPDLLLVNDGDLTYAKVRLDPTSLATVEQHLSSLADPLARNLCWAAAWDMVRDAEMAVRRFVALVSAHAPAEPDDTTLARLLAQAVSGADLYGDSSNRGKARALLAAVGRVGLEAAEPGSDRQLAWARHLLGAASPREDLDWARGVLDGSIQIPGLAVDTDLRWAIVGTLASHGVDGAEALVDAEVERDPTDIGRRRAAAALASRPTAAAKEQAWSRLLEPGVHLAELRAMAGAFWQIGQEEVLTPYAARYFEAVRPIWEERSREEAISLLGGLYPRALVDAQVVDATDALLEDASLAGPVRRILLEGKDGLERAMRARGADSQAAEDPVSAG